MAADAQQHVQSAAHPRQCAAARQPDRKRTHRYRACPQRRRRLERARRHPPHAGVPGHFVPRPAAGGFLARHAVRQIAGARRPGDRAVELRLARHDRALQDSARPHRRDPARGRHRQLQSGGGERRPHRGAAPGVGNSTADARGACSRPYRAVQRATLHDRCRAAVGQRRRPQHRLRVRRRGPRTGALRAQPSLASPHARHRHAVPHGRPLRRHAGRARGRRRRGGTGAATTTGRTRRRRSAGHGPARGRHHGRGLAGKRALPATHARRLAHRLAGAARQRERARARGRVRARQFAEFAFSPHSVAEAIRGVYTSLLARDV